VQPKREFATSIGRENRTFHILQSVRPNILMQSCFSLRSPTPRRRWLLFEGFPISRDLSSLLHGSCELLVCAMGIPAEPKSNRPKPSQVRTLKSLLVAFFSTRETQFKRSQIGPLSRIC
jgi:hypothetical protein